MTDRLAKLLEDLGRAALFDPHQRAEVIRRSLWVRQATTDEVLDLLAGCRDLPSPAEDDNQSPLAAVLGHVAVRLRGSAGPSTEMDQWPQIRQDLVALYRHLGRDSLSRHHLLAVLSHSGTAEDLEQFAETVATDPPAQGNLAVLAFAPLFQDPTNAVCSLFPRLLDALQNPSVAAPVLDLANFVTRRKLVDEHPASGRSPQLATLLGELVQRLHVFEEQARAGQHNPQQLVGDQSTVAESLSLTVALCDALALIGDTSVAGKLHQAMGLGHRHVRTEAAAALARLGQEAGNETLAAMAFEPVVRVRVLAYAEELGILEEVDEKYRSAEARAEGEVALWLADPTQVGLPPQQLELMDSRTQYWPGFDEPVDCYLFKYTFRLPHGEISNVAIAGPLVHGFAADFTDLPVDDIYAAFAGWHAEHEEILQFDADRLPPAHRPAAEALQERLVAEQYEAADIQRYGLFFGQLVLIATAVHNGTFGAVIVDDACSYWCPQAEGKRSLTAEDAYNIYKGRKLLKSFNG